MYQASYDVQEIYDFHHNSDGVEVKNAWSKNKPKLYKEAFNTDLSRAQFVRITLWRCSFFGRGNMAITCNE